MKAVFGLGNPGLEYAPSRHNVGFDVVDLYRKRHAPRLKARLIGSAIVYESRDLFLVKPMTYMNASGEAVRAVIDRFRIAYQDALVVYDDLDILLGEMKILASGGPGSHKGMISVISALGSVEIPRLRIGIGARGVHKIKWTTSLAGSPTASGRPSLPLSSVASKRLTHFEQKT